jgi:hypothetical protein
MLGKLSHRLSNHTADLNADAATGKTLQPSKQPI